MDDNCVCVTNWIQSLSNLLQELQRRQTCSTHQCFDADEFSAVSDRPRSTFDSSPEMLIVIVPLVLMVSMFLYHSGQHFFQRYSQRREEMDADCGGPRPSLPPPPPPVD